MTVNLILRHRKLLAWSGTYASGSTLKNISWLPESIVYIGQTIPRQGLCECLICMAITWATWIYSLDNPTQRRKGLEVRLIFCSIRLDLNLQLGQVQLWTAARIDGQYCCPSLQGLNLYWSFSHFIRAFISKIWFLQFTFCLVLV